MSVPNGPAVNETPLDALRTRVEEGLRSLVPSTRSRLGDAVGYALLGAGKRLRPIMVVGAALAVGRERAPAGEALHLGTLPERVWDGALAMECIHAYSLVHDDLPAMDNDDLRRGRPTVHRAFDEGLAILVGDALQSLAFECLASPRIAGADRSGRVEMDPQEAVWRLRCVRELAVAAGAQGMVEGQALDLSRHAAVDLLSVRHLHALKTGALFRACVRIGGNMAGATRTDLAALTLFGEAFGRMYQALDDLEDADEDKGPSLARILGGEDTRQDAQSSAERARAALRPFDDRASVLLDLVDSVMA